MSNHAAAVPAAPHARPGLVAASPMGTRRTKERTVVTCACGATTDRARAGKCPRCAVRASRGAELGACCAVCGHGDRRMLVLRALVGAERTTLCGNHATLLGRRALTLEALRAEAFEGGAVAAA